MVRQGHFVGGFSTKRNPKYYPNHISMRGLPKRSASCINCIGFTMFASMLLSTGERSFIDIIQDRRYWIIHIITIPSLFLSGSLFVVSGFVYKVFGSPNLGQYYLKDSGQISLINDRFSALNEIEDI